MLLGMFQGVLMVADGSFPGMFTMLQKHRQVRNGQVGRCRSRSLKLAATSRPSPSAKANQRRRAQGEMRTKQPRLTPTAECF